MSKRTPINISKPIVIFKRNGKHFTNATKQDFNNDVSYLHGTKPEDLKFLFSGALMERILLVTYTSMATLYQVTRKDLI